MKFVSAFIFSVLASSAMAAPESGVVYICSDRSGELKMTADLVSERGEKLATVAEIGSKVVLPEQVGKKLKHTFILRPSKTALFEVRKAGAKTAVLRLNIDPENTHAVTAQDQEGMKIVKLDAFLDAPTLDLHNEPVNCLETSWK